MSQPQEEDQEQTTPIPEELFSEYEERPFKSCTRCGESLVDFEEGYQIVKIWKRGECVFEYALCGPCHSRMLEEFSSESLERMQDFQDENANLSLGMQSCAICRCERGGLKEPEFGLTATCEGESLLFGFMICSDCTERMQKLISKKTRGIMDDFIEENFPGVPADALPLPKTVPIVV